MSEMTVTYIGRRMVRGEGKAKASLQRCFQEDGTTIWWAKLKADDFWGIEIGGTYTFDTFPRSWRTVKVAQADPEQTEAWELQDRAAVLENEHRKLPENPRLTDIIERLRQARATLPPSQRRKFDFWLIQEIAK